MCLTFTQHYNSLYFPYNFYLSLFDNHSIFVVGVDVVEPLKLHIVPCKDLSQHKLLTIKYNENYLLIKETPEIISQGQYYRERIFHTFRFLSFYRKYKTYSKLCPS